MGAGEDLSSVIEKIIKNPEFAGMVSELKGGERASTEDVSQEMMKKLPDVMNMVSSMFGGSEAKAESSAESVVAPVTGDAKPVSPRYDKGKAEKLLYALKPYLNSGRGEIIDRCLSVMQISDIARAIGGLEGIADAMRKGGD
ncbi:MAG: hypothetical protein IIW43_02935 [Selenomonadales bacterium]|nr:hypothetical protein [Selenomonadales bacterium]